MFRKYIFLGLMVLLGAVLVSLVLQSRETAPKPGGGKAAEVIRKSKPTLTRVIAPAELKITAEETGPRQKLTLRNTADRSYQNIGLRVLCRSRGSGAQEPMTIELKDKVAPGGKLELDRFAAQECSATVLYADLSN
jgi:hypothetical protein